MDEKKSRGFEAKSKAMVGELGRHFKAGRLKAMAGRMTENTNLVLLKSRKVFRGPKAITGFWKQLKAQGVVDIRFSVKKNMLMPVDVLMRDRPDGGGYSVYDMANHLFGTYELVFRTKRAASGNFYILPLHLYVCPREITMMVFDGI